MPAGRKTAATSRKSRLAFLYLSEPHQVFHSLGSALQLARLYDVSVDVLYASQRTADLVRAHDANGLLNLIALRTPISSHRSELAATPPRLPTLIANLDRFARYGHIVATERTSTLLRRLLGPLAPKLIHIPHGAGDRERGYDDRIRLFDMVLATGQKDYHRFLERGLATPHNCEIAGYSKPEFMNGRAKLFNNSRPVVLYNPHFDDGLSSWIGHQSEILEMIAGTPDLNFVLAPHVRLHPRHRVADPGLQNLLVDWGSLRSIDMTYTNSADIYLGDVSSQVYEFVLTPRPCVFLNPGAHDWQGDPHFAHWQLGEVVIRIADTPEALRHASVRHAHFRPVQEKLASESLDTSDKPASLRQAEAIARFAHLRLADSETTRL